MRCPACGFVSFPHLTACKKCGQPLPAPLTPVRLTAPPRPAAPKAAPPSPRGAAHLPDPSARPTPTSHPAAGPGGRGEADTVMLGGGRAAPPYSAAEDTFTFTLPPAAVTADVHSRDQLGVAPGRPAQVDFRPAGFWIRFVASFLDTIIVLAVVVIVAIPIGLSAGFLGALGDPGAMAGGLMSFGLAINAIGILVPLVYEVFFIGWRGQTPGKMVLGLKVIRMDGGDVDYVKAFIRWIGKWISGLILLIGYIMAAFTENKRALHDYIADTRVVRL